MRSVLLLIGALLSPLPVCVADPAPPLTSAAAVLALSAEQAGSRLNVALTGVVTAAEPDWKGQFFVQDDTAGIFVENLDRPAPALGDVVRVEGVSHPGAFAPIVSAPRWRKVGAGPLPVPKRVLSEDLVTGAEDGQRVEISGIVRTAEVRDERLHVDLAVAGHRLRVYARVPPDLRPESLIAARVRVRGTVAAHYISALRHLTAVAVYAPRLDDFAIVETERANPFDQPVIPVNSVAQYRPGRHAEQRVRVRGAVTLQRPGEEIFLQDSSGGLRVQSTQPGLHRIGDQVEAIGFVEYEGHLPLLRDAVLRRSTEKNFPAPPRRVPFTQITRGEHHGDFITLGGRILDRATRPAAHPDGAPAGVVTTWLVQNGDATFTIEHASLAENRDLAAIPLGSVVEADGVCVSTIEAGGTGGKLTSLRLLLPSPAGLRVLQRPSWFTPARLLTGLGLLTVVLLAVLGWLLTVARKNTALQRAVGALEDAQRKLQEAHDTLEQKVAERTAQLHVEMSARKTADVQSKAVLAERTRLARDLHDTLEQTLAGIALRLNTAARLFRRDPDASDTHLQLARNWLHQSQVSLRRSIWDLRSRELEQFDLANALRGSAEQLLDGTDLAWTFQTTGQPHALPEIVEENVLRMGQEALTNIAKHARATRVSIQLEFAPGTLRLRVEDDGVGFTPIDGPHDGHFGLLGMTERAKRLAGRLAIDSAPGRGTTLVVEIPLAPHDTPPRADDPAHAAAVV